VRSYLEAKVAAPIYKTENTAVGIRHADHVAPSISKKLAITSPTSGGRLVGIVLSQTQARGVYFSDREVGCWLIRIDESAIVEFHINV
jgi:hypothetical protein